MNSRDLGRTIEAHAEAFLVSKGLTSVDTNYCCRFGEVDLIMRDGGILVFVEVRGRRSGRFGTPAESVTAKKQRRIAVAAAHYLQRHAAFARLPCRFDVVGVVTGIRPPSVQWIKNAFDA